MSNSKSNVELGTTDSGSNLLVSQEENTTRDRMAETSPSWYYNSKQEDALLNLTSSQVNQTITHKNTSKENETFSSTTPASHLIASTEQKTLEMSSKYFSSSSNIEMKEKPSTMNTNSKEIDTTSFVTQASTDPWTLETEHSKGITSGPFTTLSNDIVATQKENETSPAGTLKTDEILHNSSFTMATENRILNNSTSSENVAISSLVNSPVLHRQKRFSQKRNRPKVYHKRFRFYFFYFSNFKCSF